MATNGINGISGATGSNGVNGITGANGAHPPPGTNGASATASSISVANIVRYINGIKPDYIPPIDEVTFRAMEISHTQLLGEFILWSPGNLPLKIPRGNYTVWRLHLIMNATHKLYAADPARALSTTEIRTAANNEMARLGMQDTGAVHRNETRAAIAFMTRTNLVAQRNGLVYEATPVAASTRSRATAPRPGDWTYGPGHYPTAVDVMAARMAALLTRAAPSGTAAPPATPASSTPGTTSSASTNDVTSAGGTSGEAGAGVAGEGPGAAGDALEEDLAEEVAARLALE